MCGIFGYIGLINAIPTLIEGLRKIEYRGYDSVGLASLSDQKLNILKTVGNVSDLENKIDGLYSNIAIGHTRWATHGEVNIKNAHPITSENCNFAVVHNGIIENYLELKSFFESKGFNFITDTDTEVIANSLSYFYDESLIEALKHTLELIKGSYAIAAITTREKDKIIVAKNGNPLVVARNENGSFASSDCVGVLNEVKSVQHLEDGDIAMLSANKIDIFDKNVKKTLRANFELASFSKDASIGKYEHYMLKEIMEQPDVISNIIKSNVVSNGENYNIKLNLKNLSEKIKDVENIIFCGSGTSYHAAYAAKIWAEKYLSLYVSCEIASDLKYTNCKISKRTLFVIFSQSGETKDAIDALMFAKIKNAQTLGIVNTLYSSISSKVDDIIFMNCGYEISVASTKAYTAMLLSVLLLNLFLANILGSITQENLNKILRSLTEIPKQISIILKNTNKIEQMAQNFKSEKYVIFLGRGLDYVTSLEASLKLKEISYIHSEAYSAGELKHGPLAVVENGTKIIGICSDRALYNPMISNLKEVESRGGNLTVFTIEKLMFESVSKDVYNIPCSQAELAPILMSVPLQIFAYYVAKAKNMEIDKPRNLAKSVTVE